MKKIFLTIITISIIIAGCQKFELQQTQVQTTNTKSQISIAPQFTVENGMLVFKTEEDFIKTLQFVSQMNYNDYIHWCQANNFTSLQKVFIDAYNSEAEYNEYCEQMQQKDATFIRNKHSDSFENLLKSKLIKEEKTSNGSVIFEINSCRKQVSYLLNINKMVSINGDIYQYDEKTIKIIKNNNFSIANKIDNINETQIDKSVIIWNDDNSKSYPSNYKSPVMLVEYDYRKPLIGKPHYQRAVEYFTESYLQKITPNGPYYLSFYAQLTNKKNGNPNQAYLTQFLNNSTFEMSYENTSGTETDNFIQSATQQWSNTTTATYYYINGIHPLTDNNNIIHMWHITDNKGTLYFYVKDKYWTPSGTVEPDIRFSYKIRSNYLIK